MNKVFFQPLTNVVNPLLLFGVFCFLSIIILVFPIPERATALLFVGFYFLFSILNPINGTVFILLSIPFFLGAPHKPYFYLFEVLVYGHLIIGFIHLWKGKAAVEIPFKPLIFLLTLSYLFSLPINFKEYYYEFWATPFKEIGFQWLTGHEKFPFFHLRTLTNALSGILLFIVTFNLFSKAGPSALEGCLKGSIWMATLICVIGFLFLFHIIPSQPKGYLSLSLDGIHEGALSAFAFNRQYLAQYLLILFPIIFYFVVESRKTRYLFSFYLFIIGVFILSLSASMQRSAFLILFLEMILLIIWYCSFISPKKNRLPLLLLGPLVIVLLMFFLDFAFLDKRFTSRLSLWGLSDPDARRPNLWKTAWHMFTYSPLLGVGLGKYFELFPDFFSNVQQTWKTFSKQRGEPHSFYLQTLSEQGAIGFLLLVGLILLIGYLLIKKAKEDQLGHNRLYLGVLFVSLTGWLLLGFFHNVSYVRSLGVLLWILLGWSAALIGPKALLMAEKLNNKRISFVLVIMIAAFGFQIWRMSDRPLSPNFQTGIYGKEVVTGGESIHWMGKRAVLNTKIKNEAVLIQVSAPLPEIQQRGQKIRFWAGAHFQEILLNDDHWHQISIPVGKDLTGWIPLKMETAYTFNPQKAKISQDDRDLGIRIRGID